MNRKIINAAVCDARDVAEESLSGFDSITINAAILITGPRSKALLNRYPVALNAANVLEIPDGENITVKSINGKGELGPDSDGSGVFLMVNGKLTIADGSAEAVQSYYRIMVNGKVLMPLSFKGKFSNIQVNGKTAYYPDGAAILQNDTEIDSLFLARATRTRYYCPGNLFFLDGALDVGLLAEKGIRFTAGKIVIAESLLPGLISQIDEETEILRVPDGARLIGDDLELEPRTIRKFGTKLCVCGDVSVLNAEALSSLEYLFADGTVRVRKDLTDAFDDVESVYDELKIIDPDRGYLADRPFVRIGPSILRKYPSGVRVADCAKVTISAELSPEEIMEKLQIADCALVVCTKEQEEAVHMIAEDTALIRVSGDPDAAEDGMAGDMVTSFLEKPKDALVINAANYKM